MKALDIEAVQAFVAVADLRSFTRAAEVLETSQAAISLKLKRLEDRLGRRLLERTPRMVRLSAQGAAFLAPARALLSAHEQAIADLSEAPGRLAIGIGDHVAGPDLPVLLARLAAHDPVLTIEVRIGASRALLEAFDRGEIDAAIIRQVPDRRDGEFLMADPVAWFASPTWVHHDVRPLRLASLASPCSIRANALKALDAAGIAWTEVFVGGGIVGVGAAVSAGLAVAALARRVAPVGAVDVGDRLGLPPVPPAEVVLHSNVTDARSRAALRVLAATLRGVSARREEAA
jgi:DNA-binding transcriptional LysR family regulator